MPSDNTSTYSNSTAYTSHWKPEPEGRGTWSLVYSCLFTLTLCVYSAIHLNIPPTGEKESIQSWRKAKWVLIAIFAPEVVLFAAWQQFYVARKFCREFHTLMLQQEGIDPIPEDPWWKCFRFHRQVPQTVDEGSDDPTFRSMPRDKTQTNHPTQVPLFYGFYVVMGGLTVDVSDIYDNISFVALTPGGALKFARKTSWKRFFVKEVTIQDKSKADGLAKLLVAFQVSWTLLQCVARYFNGLPLTILEVHTLVHAACAMMMYGLWFYKPLNVRDATLVDTAGFADELALDLLRTTNSIQPPFNNFQRPGGYRKYIYHNGTVAERETTEASILLFDTKRLDAALEGSQNHAGATRSILPQSGQALTRQPSNDSTRRQDGATSVMRRNKPAQKEIGSCRSAHVSAVTEKTLKTGQTLWNGIGPSSLPTGPDQPISPGFRGLIKKALGRREPTERIAVDASLARLISASVHKRPDPATWHHQISFFLSTKDILRWNRAGTAFAHEFAATRLSQERFPNTDSSPSKSGTFHQPSEAEAPNRCNLQGSTGKLLPEEDGHHQKLVYGLGTAERAPNLPTEVDSTKRPRLLTLSSPSPSSQGFFDQDACVLRAPNFQADVWDRLSTSGNLQGASLSALAMVSGVYAGIHLALWNFTFPSHVEMLLWKISGCVLGTPTGGFIIYALLCLGFLITGKPIESWDGPLGGVINIIRCILGSDNPNSWHIAQFAHKYDGWLRTLLVFIDSEISLALSIFELMSLLLFAMFVVLGAGLYIFSRVFIVLEAFLSLRLVPVGVYEGTTWAQYVPHF